MGLSAIFALLPRCSQANVSPVAEPRQAAALDWRPMPDTLQGLAQRLQVTVDSLLAKPRDPRETTMRDLERERRWDDLERLAK